MNRQEIRKVVKRMKPSSFEILWKKPYTQLESLAVSILSLSLHR